MIINNEFESHLSKFEPKNNDGPIETFVVLIYEDLGSSQEFLRSLDENFATSCMSDFVNPTWKHINFQLAISNLKLNFGGLEFRCQLTNIGISRSESKKGLSTKYSIKFRLDEAKTFDTMKIEMALKEFLNRKEIDAKGKKVLQKFKTKISKLF